MIFLDLAYYLWRAEVPLLADNFPKRALAVGRPSQDELLRPRGFFFFKDKRYLFQPLRLIENQPNRLGSGYSCTPALRFSQNEGRLDREISVFRGDFNNRCPLNIEPAFTAGSNTLWRWGNKPFAHTGSSLPLVRLRIDSHDNRTNSSPDAMEFHRHRALGCRNGGSRTVLASNVCEGNALFRRWGLRQRYCGPVVGRAGLADQRNQRISRVGSCAFGLAGTQGYLFYNFVIYALGVHFNALFLVYCATLGLCFYATVFSVSFIPIEQIAQAYGPRAPRKTIATAFFVLAIATAAFDLRENIPAILMGRVPQSVIETNQPVNFVHVLDVAFLLPALCITAVLLFRRKAAGYALAPVFLTLLAIMSMELASIVAVMGRAGFGMNFPMTISFVVLGVGFTIPLWFYFSLVKRAAWAGLPSAGRES